MDEQQLYWTAWWSVDGIGWATLQRLIRLQSQLGCTWAELWRQSQLQSERLGLSLAQGEAVRHFAARFSPKSYHDYLHQKKIWVVTRDSPGYPSLLKQIPDPPPVLFGQGASEVLTQPMIGVVGTRHITPYGQLVTRKITRELVDDGWAVVSGFMYGVDVTSHQTAAEAGGKTIGVLGYGFDHVFPKSQVPLLTQLTQAGQCFVTEYAPHVVAQAGLFPRRNRVIAGMSQGVVVTEAAAQSGSLITAEMAAEYGRSVYAVPGPITSPFSNGTRALLNMGALCVGSGGEVTTDQAEQGQRLPSLMEMSEHCRAVLRLLSQKGTTVTELQKELVVETAELLSTLSLLEIQGKISRVGEFWQLSK